MERVKTKGRPKLASAEIRKPAVRIWLTSSELVKLQKEHEGSSVEFGVFCREKLLNREAKILKKPLPEEVKNQMTNILRMSGSVLLLAKTTSAETIISDEFREMAAGLKRMIQRADFSINELVLSQSLIASILPLFSRLESLGMNLSENQNELAEIKDLVHQIKNKLLPFTEMYNLKVENNDR